MGPDSLSSAVQRVLDESSWRDGNPPERSLVALFAAMAPQRLDQFLREMVKRAFVELESEAEVGALISIGEVVAGTRRHQDLDEVEWEFPGGDFLLDAVQAVEASSRLSRSALKSLTHAVEAAELAIGAVVEHRDWQRDPDGWALYRQKLAEPEPMDPKNISPERMALRTRDRHEVWALLLSALRTDPPSGSEPVTPPSTP